MSTPPTNGTVAPLAMTPLGEDETKSEYINDFVLGIAFVCVGVAAAQRYVSRNTNGIHGNCITNILAD